MNEYEQKELDTFFKHGEIMIEEYQEYREDETIEDYDAIICTENGTIAFLVQDKNLMYEMGYNSIALMQYCTDNNNKWTEKIIWVNSDYWVNRRDDFERIEDD